MATTKNKRSALSDIRSRHPVIPIQLDADGNALAPSAALVAATRDAVLHNTSKNLFHPIAAYGRSISRVARRATLAGDLLFSLEQEYRDRLLGRDIEKELHEDYKALLDAYESYLFALEAHFDDLKNIAMCFYEEQAKQIRCDHLRRYKIELEAISGPSAYVVNKIKHNLASLAGFYAVATTGRHRFLVPGFVLSRVNGESLGPDPDFEGFENSAISFFSDFRRSLTSIFVASACLADFLSAKGVSPASDLKSSGHLNDAVDMLYSISRLAYPTERHQFISDFFLSGFRHKRSPMPTSIRDGGPPPDLQVVDFKVMYEGDGYTRSFKIPLPVKIRKA